MRSPSASIAFGVAALIVATIVASVLGIARSCLAVLIVLTVAWGG